MDADNDLHLLAKAVNAKAKPVNSQQNPSTASKTQLFAWSESLLSSFGGCHLHLATDQAT